MNIKPLVLAGLTFLYSCTTTPKGQQNQDITNKTPAVKNEMPLGYTLEEKVLQIPDLSQWQLPPDPKSLRERIWAIRDVQPAGDSYIVTAEVQDFYWFKPREDILDFDPAHKPVTEHNIFLSPAQGKTSLMLLKFDGNGKQDMNFGENGAASVSNILPSDLMYFSKEYRANPAIGQYFYGTEKWQQAESKTIIWKDKIYIFGTKRGDLESPEDRYVNGNGLVAYRFMLDGKPDSSFGKNGKLHLAKKDKKYKFKNRIWCLSPEERKNKNYWKEPVIALPDRLLFTFAEYPVREEHKNEQSKKYALDFYLQLTSEGNLELLSGKSGNPIALTDSLPDDEGVEFYEEAGYVSKIVRGNIPQVFEDKKEFTFEKDNATVTYLLREQPLDHPLYFNTLDNDFFTEDQLKEKAKSLGAAGDNQDTLFKKLKSASWYSEDPYSVLRIRTENGEQTGTLLKALLRGHWGINNDDFRFAFGNCKLYPDGSLFVERAAYAKNYNMPRRETKDWLTMTSSQVLSPTFIDIVKFASDGSLDKSFGVEGVVRIPEALSPLTMAVPTYSTTGTSSEHFAFEKIPDSKEVDHMWFGPSHFGFTLVDTKSGVSATVPLPDIVCGEWKNRNTCTLYFPEERCDCTSAALQNPAQKHWMHIKVKEYTWR